MAGTGSNKAKKRAKRAKFAADADTAAVADYIAADVMAAQEAFSKIYLWGRGKGNSPRVSRVAAILQ